MVKERAFWLAWSQVNGMGSISLRRLQKHFGTLAAAWAASPEDLLAVEGFGLLTVDAMMAARREIQPETLLGEHERENPNFLTPADADYPRLLLETPDPPPVLYFRGEISAQEFAGQVPMVGMVGTRSPSGYGKDSTRQLAAALAKQGFTIVSGLAAGIDTDAHRSCLDAGGRTIAVLGCGVDVVYPWSNRKLYEDVIAGGLIVSEYPAGTQPDRVNFPRRNRIIAGLCRATLVMEAPAKSGGLITAHYANEYGRDVYALPGQINNPKAIGCLNLIQNGATVIVSQHDLIASLGMTPQLDSRPAIAQPSLPLDLSSEAQHILETLTTLSQTSAEASVSLDLLVQKTGLDTGSVLATLTTLEMENLVKTLPGMRYQRL